MFAKSIRSFISNSPKSINHMMFFSSHNHPTKLFVDKIKNEVSILDNNENYNPDYNHLMIKYGHIYTYDLCPSFDKNTRKYILGELSEKFTNRLVVFDMDCIINNKHGIFDFNFLNDKHIAGTNIKYGITHLFQLTPMASADESIIELPKPHYEHAPEHKC